MGALTTIGSRIRRTLETADGGRNDEVGTAIQLHQIVTSTVMPPPTSEQIANRSCRLRLLVEDVDTGERIVLAEALPWRSIEVLGSAALYYATHYDNHERPFEQVRGRRRRANDVGAAIWNIAETRVGIEEPVRPRSARSSSANADVIGGL